MLLRILFLSFAIFSSIGMAQRNPFKVELTTTNNLQKIVISDLHFTGAITQKNFSIGFVQDVLGNYYPLKIGQTLGEPPAKIISILPDKLVLIQGEHYVVIK